MPPRARLTPRPSHTFDRQARIQEQEATIRELVAEIDRQKEALGRFAGYRQEMVAANHALMSDLLAVCRERDLLRDLLREYTQSWWYRLMVLISFMPPPSFRGPATEHVKANYQVDAAAEDRPEAR